MERGPAVVPAVRCRPCAAPHPLPTLDELVELAGEHGIEHLGVAPAAVLDRARDALHQRQAAGLHAGMEFTYRNPDRSTDPARAVAGARSSSSAPARTWPTTTPPRPAGAQGARRPVRLGRPLRAAPRRACGRSARRLRAAGHRAVVFADDNSIVDREVAYLAGLGWFGKNANLLLPGAGSWFVLGCVVTTADVPGRPAGGRRMRVVPALPRRLPDRRDRGARRRRRQPLPGVARAAARARSRSSYREALGDRFYGCDDCQRSARRRSASAATTPSPLDDGAQALGRRARRARAADDRAARPPRAVVPRRSRPAVVAAQRADRARQHRRSPATPDGRRHRCRYRAAPDPILARARRVGAAASASDCSGVDAD